jgi:hypothetical protein
MYGSTSKPWSSSNIWGNGNLSNGFPLRVNTRENSRSRDIPQISSRPSADEVEGKSGSSQLLEGTSEINRHNWGLGSQHGAQQHHAPNRSFSQTRYPDKSMSQQRSFSTAGPAQSYGGAQNLPTLQTTRAPTISLNQSSSNQSRRQEPPISTTFPGRFDDPVPVYTKWDRQDKPKDPLAMSTDSPIGAWADAVGTPSGPPSPEELRAPYNAYSAKTLAHAGWPSSRSLDNTSIYPPSDSLSQRPTPPSTRTPSTSSSQRNGAFASDQLSSQISQLSVGSHSRQPTSYKSGLSVNGFSPQSTTGGVLPPFVRAPSQDHGQNLETEDEVEVIDRSGLQYLGLNDFTPQQATAVGDYNNSPFGTRFSQSTNTVEYRNAQSFTPLSMSSRSFEPPTGPRTPGDWQIFTPAATPYNRRSPNVPDPQPFLNPHVQQLLQLRNPYAQMYSPYGLPNGVQLPPVQTYLNLVPLPLNGVDANAVSREAHGGDGVQSALMYEFKSNAKSKRYELRDIYDHIAEFSGDQHGSRFIQTKLETANSDEKERVFREIEPNAIPLMTDVFGNYVIQKFFEHGDQTHKKILANKMRGQVLSLSLGMYGCRVVQKALEHVLVDQQAQLVGELRDHVIQCVKDQNGNHVIQKAIERCPPQTIDFITIAFRGQVHQLSIHAYGCRVIQRCLERCDTPSKSAILSELMDGIPTMIPDQYGNYVVQHIVSKDDGFGRNRVLSAVLNQLENFSKHKFASNVVEKCIEQADDNWRRQVVFTLANINHSRSDGGGVLVSMIKDNFGNYVIRKFPFHSL